MERSSVSVLSQLVFLVFLIGYATATTTTTTMKGGGRKEMRHSGFLYTRNRGRFWSSRREAWPRMIPQTASVSRIFGSRAFERYRNDLTLLQATEKNDDNNAFSSLLKQSSAALLNSYTRKNFPFSAWEVKTLLIQALVSEKAAALQAKRFSLANEACT
ncbi:hypothetical protein AQUCO_01700730v1 [Aquilegia coerulea]|uniref:Uncharacterized protein n=1 Tax=Aquilegia coerulea TaxID=218851 RepID=A0A2G5DPC7_AQUCA|nr:hypothetical protein AQUCO_01700730v1 [Aquilegia coerulea]